MSIINLSKLLLIGSILLFLNCEVEFFDENVTTSSETGFVAGLVTNVQDNALSDVEIKVEGQTVYSSSDGTFIIGNIPVGENRILTFSLDTYATNQKVADVLASDTVFVKASLGSWDAVIQIPSAQDNTVSFNNATVKLPADGLVDENGQTVSGDVTVNASCFLPTDPNYGELFPGKFEGEDSNGNEVAIESFGFITVEIKQGVKELDLATGQKSEISIPVPSSILGNAPASIPLWYFDKEQGTWVEEGSATLQNGNYKGEVSHFSSWNADYPIQTSYLKGRVLCEDGITPVAGALVVAEGLDYTGWTSTYTDTLGWYVLTVKADSQVKLIASQTNDYGVPITFSKEEIVTTGSGQSTATPPILYLDCSNQLSYIYDIYSDTDEQAWAVGENGKIYEKREASWIIKTSGTTQALYALDCPSYDNFWTVGSNGIVLYSTDKSDSWSKVDIGSTYDLYDIEFNRGYYGWIVGENGSIFSTLDGGQNWTPQTSGSVQILKGCSFVNPLEGWVCGTTQNNQGTILHTTDGGQSWTSQNSGVPENLNDICFIDNQKGWAVGGNGTIIRTSDGGQSWQTQVSGTTENLNALDFWKIEGGGGYIAGDNGIHLKSQDGGTTWSKDTFNDVPTNTNLFAVDANSAGYTWIGGNEVLYTYEFPGVVYGSGYGWAPQENIADSLWAVHAISQSEAIVVGSKGLVLKTTNGGNSWSNVGNLSQDLYTIDIIGSTVWVGGKDIFSISNDLGATWQNVNVIPSGQCMIQVQFVDQNHGWALMSDRKIYKQHNPFYDNYAETTAYSTSDGGYTWSKMSNLPLGETSHYDDFIWIDAQSGWYTDLGMNTANGIPKLYYTRDGGNTFNTEELIYSPFQVNDYWKVRSLAIYANADQLWIFDGDHRYYKETGKALCVSESQLVIPHSLVVFPDQTGWMLGTYGIFKTLNSGQTWNQTSSVSHGSDIHMIDSSTGWVSNLLGKILFTDNGGL